MHTLLLKYQQQIMEMVEYLLSLSRSPLWKKKIKKRFKLHSKNYIETQEIEARNCTFTGLTAYNMPQGNTLEGRYNFTDSVYDGLIKNNFLSSGLGFLTDGSLALEDYVIDNGLGWIGWHAVHTPTPNVIFKFWDTRIFHNVTIHCNVRDSASIQLFSQVEVSFSNDGVTFNTTMSHRPKTVTSGTGWKNHNVTIDLCRNTGKEVTFNFSYAGDWILMSEITFNSGRSMFYVTDRCCSFCFAGCSMVVSPLGVSSRILASGAILASTRFCLKTTGQVLFMWLFVLYVNMKASFPLLGGRPRKLGISLLF